VPLDADLLSQARTAEAHVIDAEHDAEVARAEFHRAVRRLQLAGGSLREIAEALGLSHQRVHQIVDSAGGSRSWRKGHAGAGELLSCSFCGKQQKQIKKLIAGPSVYICNECIHRVHAVLVAAGKTVRSPPWHRQVISRSATSASGSATRSSPKNWASPAAGHRG